MVTRTAWLLFIRAASSRFEGKCYYPILNRNILAWLSLRSKSAGILPRDLFLCTSNMPENKSLILQAQQLGHSVLIGPEDYPIQRITCNWNLIETYTAIVRICGDSPLYPFSFVRRTIEFYRSDKSSAITNTRLRNFPSGFSIEIYYRSQLYNYLKINPEQSRLEHMSDLLEYQSLIGANIIDIQCNEAIDFFHSDRYTVDYIDDIYHIELCLTTGQDIIYEQRLSALSFC